MPEPTVSPSSLASIDLVGTDTRNRDTDSTFAEDARPSELPTSSLNAISSLSDRDLLDAWTTDGCRDAIEALVRRYHTMVAAVCQRRCRSHADAEDATQTTFFFLATSASKIRNPDRLAGWLHRVAQRSSVATLRSREHDDQPMIDVPEKPTDPLSRLTRRHEAMVLDEELSNLPDKYRSAIVLHVLEECTFDDVAKRMETSAGSVRGYIQRGKKLLARRLRSRGVAPILAFAAVNAWPASTATASDPLSLARSPDVADATDWLSEARQCDFSCLETLLQSGPLPMTVITTLSTAATAAVFAAIVWALPAPTESDGSPTTTMVLETTSRPEDGSRFVAQLGPAVPPQQAAGDQMGRAAESTGTTNSGMVDSGSGGGLNERSEPKMTKVAEEATAALDALHPWSIHASLTDAARVIADKLSVPVMFDDRALLAARLDPRSVTINLDVETQPVRTSLRQMLRPLGLKMTVEDEGLVVTADMTALARKGIATDRWLDMTPRQVERMEDVLASTVQWEFHDTPLAEVADSIAQSLDYPVLIDYVALEEFGLSKDEPVTFSISNVSARSALKLMLRQKGLLYNFRN
ncbi:MAG: sigma-70 family RNA polymerase sigma factor [Planctomycetota bacterium]